MSDPAYVLQHIVANFLPTWGITLLFSFFLIGLATRFLRGGLN